MNQRSNKPNWNFKQRLRETLQRRVLSIASTRIRKHQYVYLLEDKADSVYFIESGQIKLLMLSPEGKECVIAIYTAGDIFGESCLSGPVSRQETAVAMEETVLRQIPSVAFIAHLSSHSLVEDFVRYLVDRVAEQDRFIANLITVDSEHRLGQTLLLLARKIGQLDARRTRIKHKITHEELSEMVGTTRPRITEFMRKFRDLGLIETSREHHLIIDEKRLTEYLVPLT